MKSKMKFIHIWMCVCCILLVGVLAGCGKTTGQSQEESVQSREEASEQGGNAASDMEHESAAAQSQVQDTEEPVTLRIGALKGPTTMGLLFMMEAQKDGSNRNDYEFQMATGADELLPLMVSGKLDIALVPANVAAVLYQKTEGNVAVIDINTLGVLYMVSNDPNVTGIQDLKGKTVYLTGKGTTPDYVLQYLLKGAGYAQGDVTLEYKSEATEVAAILAQTEGALGFLPQPFVTAAGIQNDKLRIVFSANDAWLEQQGEKASGLVTGVTVVRKDILADHPGAVKTFLEEHAVSAKAINDDPETGAKYCVEAGIVAKEPIAQKAIPKCNITCVTGTEMKEALSAYLQILFDYDPKTVGGQLPAEDFYYLAD